MNEENWQFSTVLKVKKFWCKTIVIFFLILFTFFLIARNKFFWNFLSCGFFFEKFCWNFWKSLSYLGKNRILLHLAKILKVLPRGKTVQRNEKKKLQLFMNPMLAGGMFLVTWKTSYGENFVKDLIEGFIFHYWDIPLLGD